MTTVAFLGMKPGEEDYVRTRMAGMSGVSLFFTDQTLLPEALQRDADMKVLSVFVTSPVLREVLDALPHLKCIAARSTGYDHIAVDVCKERGIRVATVPHYGGQTVAEYTFALLLALSRKVCSTSRRLREEGDCSTEGLQGFDLKGKTLGVVGTGSIGRHVIRIAQGFDLSVLAFDTRPDTALADTLGFSYVSLETLMARSDIVTLHVPYLPETHHLINAGLLARMKKGAYFINTSRGALVDTEALLRVLQEGHLAGAGLDVLEEEPATALGSAPLPGDRADEERVRKIVAANRALIQLPTVLVTAHNAFNTAEACERILDTTIENIKRFLSGNPQNTVA